MVVVVMVVVVVIIIIIVVINDDIVVDVVAELSDGLAEAQCGVLPLQLSRVRHTERIAHNGVELLRLEQTKQRIWLGFVGRLVR